MRWRWLDIVLFLSVYGPRRSRKRKSQKRTRPISSHLYRTNLVNKGFILWLLGKFCLRDSVGSPERARSLHLTRSGSQSQRAISFILPARGASHIIFLSQASERAGFLNPRIWLANHAHVTGPAFYDTAHGPDFFPAQWCTLKLAVIVNLLPVLLFHRRQVNAGLSLFTLKWQGKSL